MLIRIAVLASIAASAHAQLAYTIEALPPLPGTWATYVTDVGGLGAVGVAFHPSDAKDAVLWTGGAPVVLPPPPGTWELAWAEGASQTHIVGHVDDSTYTNANAVRWTGGVPTVLPLPPGADEARAFAVADDGVVVGEYGGDSGHACRWSSSGIVQPLPEPVGTFRSKAVAIGADGTVVGWFKLFGGQFGICAWTPYGQTMVLAQPGPDFLIPEAIAADGTVYGWNFGQSLPFRLIGGVVTPAPTLTWQGAPMEFGAILDADSSGRAVGWSRTTTGTERATLWVGSNVIKAVNLRSLVLTSDDWILEQAVAIDESGRIAGYGLHNGVGKAFLLRPAGSWGYCTAGTSSGGCVATLSASGTPSASAASGFTLSAAGADAQRSGFVFYGVSGTAASPWGSGTSFLCVESPTQRTGAASSGGTSGQCNGSLTLDWNAYMSSHGGALGNPRAPGLRVQAQAWLRDPPSASPSALSSAVEFVLAP